MPIKNLGKLSPEQLRENGRKGGKVKSDRKKFAASMRFRKYCKHHCLIFPCAFEPESRTLFKGMCALSKTDLPTQRAVWDIFSKGEEGLDRHLINLYFEVGRGTSNLKTKEGEEVSPLIALEKKRQLFHDAGFLKKYIYGDKSRVKQEVDLKVEGVMTWDDWREAYKEYKAEKKEAKK